MPSFCKAGITSLSKILCVLLQYVYMRQENVYLSNQLTKDYMRDSFKPDRKHTLKDTSYFDSKLYQQYTDIVWVILH